MVTGARGAVDEVPNDYLTILTHSCVGSDAGGNDSASPRGSARTHGPAMLRCVRRPRRGASHLSSQHVELVHCGDVKHSGLSALRLDTMHTVHRVDDDTSRKEAQPGRKGLVGSR